MRFLLTTLRWACLALCLCLAVVFAANNPSPVTLSLFPLPFEAAMPLFAAGLVFMLIGATLGSTYTAWRSLKIRRECTRLRKRLQATQNELETRKMEQLRALPPAA